MFISKTYMLLIFLSFNLLSCSVKSAEQSVKIKDKTHIKIFNVCKSGIDYTVDFVDTLLTKKGVIRASLVIVPILGIYSYLYSPIETQKLLNRLVSTSAAKTFGLSTQLGKLHGAYNLGYDAGIYGAAQNSFYNSPGTTSVYYLSKVTEYFFKAGIPFLSGFALKTYFKTA